MGKEMFSQETPEALQPEHTPAQERKQSRDWIPFFTELVRENIKAFRMAVPLVLLLDRSQVEARQISVQESPTATDAFDIVCTVGKQHPHRVRMTLLSGLNTPSNDVVLKITEPDIQALVDANDDGTPLKPGNEKEEDAFLEVQWQNSQMQKFAGVRGAQEVKNPTFAQALRFYKGFIRHNLQYAVKDDVFEQEQTLRTWFAKHKTWENDGDEEHKKAFNKNLKKKQQIEQSIDVADGHTFLEIVKMKKAICRNTPPMVRRMHAWMKKNHGLHLQNSTIGGVGGISPYERGYSKDHAWCDGIELYDKDGDGVSDEATVVVLDATPLGERVSLRDVDVIIESATLWEDYYKPVLDGDVPDYSNTVGERLFWNTLQQLYIDKKVNSGVMLSFYRGSVEQYKRRVRLDIDKKIQSHSSGSTEQQQKRREAAESFYSQKLLRSLLEINTAFAKDFSDASTIDEYLKDHFDLQRQYLDHSMELGEKHPEWYNILLESQKEWKPAPGETPNFNYHGPTKGLWRVFDEKKYPEKIPLFVSYLRTLEEHCVEILKTLPNNDYRKPLNQQQSILFRVRSSVYNKIKYLERTK